MLFECHCQKNLNLTVSVKTQTEIIKEKHIKTSFTERDEKN